MYIHDYIFTTNNTSCMSLETIMQFIFVKVQVLQNNNGSFFDAQCITNEIK